MDVKYNDSTYNRPWGERPVDAPIVPIDVHAYTQQLMEEEAWQKSDRNAITVFKSEGVTVVIVALHKDAVMKPGTVEGTGIMTLQVMDGHVNFRTENESLDLHRGQMVVLHEHIPYSATAMEESICVLTMVRAVADNSGNNNVPSAVH
jgi:quercetin dioxygenase-like cupin family protein